VVCHHVVGRGAVSNQVAVVGKNSVVVLHELGIHHHGLRITLARAAVGLIHAHLMRLLRHARLLLPVDLLQSFFASLVSIAALKSVAEIWSRLGLPLVRLGMDWHSVVVIGHLVDLVSLVRWVLFMFVRSARRGGSWLTNGCLSVLSISVHVRRRSTAVETGRL